jgi:hypothetical protein
MLGLGATLVKHSPNAVVVQLNLAVGREREEHCNAGDWPSGISRKRMPPQSGQGDPVGESPPSQRHLRHCSRRDNNNMLLLT